jgi:hypothetical protein
VLRRVGEGVVDGGVGERVGPIVGLKKGSP